MNGGEKEKDRQTGRGKQSENEEVPGEQVGGEDRERSSGRAERWRDITEKVLLHSNTAGVLSVFGCLRSHMRVYIIMSPRSTAPALTDYNMAPGVRRGESYAC